MCTIEIGPAEFGVEPATLTCALCNCSREKDCVVPDASILKVTQVAWASYEDTYCFAMPKLVLPLFDTSRYD
jgi:hypothetical protein